VHEAGLPCCPATWRGGTSPKGPCAPLHPPWPWGNDTGVVVKDAGASPPRQHHSLHSITTYTQRSQPFPPPLPFVAIPTTDPRGTAKPRQPQDPWPKPSLPNCKGSAAAPGSSQAWLPPPPLLPALHTMSTSRAAGEPSLS